MIYMYEYFFYRLAYPFLSTWCFLVWLVFFFCDDHIFGRSKWSCKFKDTFEGWGFIN